jgi:hypothetical protein
MAFIFKKTLGLSSSRCWAMIRADRKCESGRLDEALPVEKQFCSVDG